MGVIKQGILGGFQGAVGSVVGSSWKGINVMKAKPVSVANPRTAGQIAQRTLMTNCVAFAQAILASAIKPLWDRFASKMSGYNDWVSANIAQFINPTPALPEQLVFSRGKMDATFIDSVVADNSLGTIVVNWTNDAGSGLKLATDEAYAMAFNQQNGDIYPVVSNRTRNQGSATITANADMQVGNTVHVYLAFRRADGTVVSNNSYQDTVVQA